MLRHLAVKRLSFHCGEALFSFSTQGDFFAAFCSGLIITISTYLEVSSYANVRSDISRGRSIISYEFKSWQNMSLLPALAKFPKYPLTFGKTPIHPLKRLSAALGGKVSIHAKREDINSGLAFGGNKTRKLEYLVPQALAGGYTHLVSIGGVQSNQTRQVAAVAAHLGLKCVLVQEKWVNHSEDEGVYGKVGNVQMSRILGADVRLDDRGFDIGIRESWKEALEEIEKEGGKPYPIPAGCSVHELGGLGFVGWAEEVRE